MNKPETKCLNTIKFFAACIVAFLYHYYHFLDNTPFPFESVFEWSYQSGYLMVELFFMLSGFGMFLGYEEKIIKGNISFKDYLYKRLRKIYPLFIFSLFVITVLESFHIMLTSVTFPFSDDSFDIWHFFINIILCQDGIFGTELSFNVPAWSISIFFLLYIIFFIVIRHSKSKYAILNNFICLFLLGSVPIIMAIDWPFLLNQRTGRGIASFSIGVILALMYKYYNKLNFKLIGYCSLSIVIIYHITYRVDSALIDKSILFYIMFVAPAVIISVLYIPWLNKLFSLKPFQFLGSISFEIYLLHFCVQCAIKDIDLALGLNINYSKSLCFIIYPIIVLFVCIIYKLCLAKYVEKALYEIVKKFQENN